MRLSLLPALLPGLLLLLCALLVAPCRADMHSAHDTIAACLREIGKSGARGLEAVKPVCPDLESALSESGLANQLGANWRKQLTRSQLVDLEWLTQRYGLRTGDTGPDIRSLSDIARELRGPPTKPGWWERVKEWLRHLLEPTQSSGSNWFDRLLNAISRAPRQLWTVIQYAGAGVIVVMTLVMVWREIRIAREATRRAQGRERSPTVMTRPRETSISLGELDAAPRIDQPVLLLRLLVQSLLASGRITGARSLTHGELIVRGRFDDPEQQGRFARISRLAERRLYGSPPAVGAPTGPELEQAVADGRRLYAQLSNSPTAAR